MRSACHRRLPRAGAARLGAAGSVCVYRICETERAAREGGGWRLDEGQSGESGSTVHGARGRACCLGRRRRPARGPSEWLPPRVATDQAHERFVFVTK
eukprot:4231609-Prymnesium_polylepis.1